MAKPLQSLVSFGCWGRNEQRLLSRPALSGDRKRHQKKSMKTKWCTRSVRSFLFLAVRPGAPLVASLLLVAMPFAPSSFSLLVGTRSITDLKHFGSTIYHAPNPSLDGPAQVALLTRKRGSGLSGLHAPGRHGHRIPWKHLGTRGRY